MEAEGDPLFTEEGTTVTPIIFLSRIREKKEREGGGEGEKGKRTWKGGRERTYVTSLGGLVPFEEILLPVKTSTCSSFLFFYLLFPH